MKTGIYLALFIFISAFYACEKDDDTPAAALPPSSQSRYDILTSHYWRIGNTNVTAIGDTNGDSVIDTSYTTIPPDSCFGDDKYYFKSNGFLTADFGTVICAATPDSSSWSLANNDTEIIIDSTAFSIVSISSSQFVIEQTISIFPFTMTITMAYVYP